MHREIVAIEEIYSIGLRTKDQALLPSKRSERVMSLAGCHPARPRPAAASPCNESSLRAEF